ncbi:MAG: hypothetical protein PHV06_04695 [bacterium]|nr:hypothetical protein [bacterium]
MRLPRKKILIENVNLLYIDIPKIIQLSQVDRRAKIDGYLSVIYPGSQDIIFLKKGEMINAGTFVGPEKKPVSVFKALDRMKKKEDDGSVFYSEIEESLLKLLVAIFYFEPKHKNLSSKYTNIRKLFEVIQKNKFEGFLEFEINNGLNFIEFSGEKIGGCFFCDDVEEPLSEVLSRGDDQMIIESVISMIENHTEEVLVNIFNKVEELKMQISPAQIQMLEKVVNSIIDGVSKSIGMANTIDFMQLSLEETTQKHKFLKDVNLTNNVCKLDKVFTDPDLFVRSIAEWINGFVDKASLSLGDKTYEITYNCIKDMRFALEKLKFFNSSYLKSMLS